MQITITSDQLTSIGACEDGIDDFIAVHGDAWTVEWNLKAQIEFIQGPLKKYFAWAVDAGLLPMLSMAGADLGGADLSCVNLYGADLRGANLRRADLRWANLRRADLRGAVYDRVDLYGANLNCAIFAGGTL